MSETVYTFKKQLGVGKSGEAAFASFYKRAKPSEERAYDFLLLGKKIELKTDSHDMMATENYFMEKFGHVENSKLGGPWRAKEDGIDFFVYFYIQNGVFLWFDTKALVRFLNRRVPKIKSKIVRNKGYNSLGYLIPRTDLEHLVVRKDKIKNVRVRK